jgi:hypothetical protein
MGFMDKVKLQAEQAMVKAQQGLNQGQAKLDQYQASKAGEQLLRDLGAVFYANQRSGGSNEDVGAALAALDQHVATYGPLPTGPAPAPGTVSFNPPGDPTVPPPVTMQAPPMPAPPTPAPGAPAPPPPAAPSGGFNLDDI